MPRNNAIVPTGHADCVGGVAWHPQATLTQGEGLVNLVSGAGDMSVNLWSLNRYVHPMSSPNHVIKCTPISDAPLATMKGHAHRICRVAFHPSGDYVASASFDTSWRLWDVTTQKEILLQEGHSKGVYSVEFQDDGALVASGSVRSPSQNSFLTLTLLPAVWIPSDACGIYARAERPWSLTVTSKPFSESPFPPTGTSTTKIHIRRSLT